MIKTANFLGFVISLQCIAWHGVSELGFQFLTGWWFKWGQFCNDVHELWMQGGINPFQVSCTSCPPTPSLWICKVWQQFFFPLWTLFHVSTHVSEYWSGKPVGKTPKTSRCWKSTGMQRSLEMRCGMVAYLISQVLRWAILTILHVAFDTSFLQETLSTHYTGYIEKSSDC